MSSAQIDPDGDLGSMSDAAVMALGHYWLQEHLAHHEVLDLLGLDDRPDGSKLSTHQRYAEASFREAAIRGVPGAVEELMGVYRDARDPEGAAAAANHLADLGMPEALIRAAVVPGTDDDQLSSRACGAGARGAQAFRFVVRCSQIGHDPRPEETDELIGLARAAAIEARATRDALVGATGEQWERASTDLARVLERACGVAVAGERDLDAELFAEALLRAATTEFAAGPAEGTWDLEGEYIGTWCRVVRRACGPVRLEERIEQEVRDGNTAVRGPAATEHVKPDAPHRADDLSPETVARALGLVERGVRMGAPGAVGSWAELMEVLGGGRGHEDGELVTGAMGASADRVLAAIGDAPERSEERVAVARQLDRIGQHERAWRTARDELSGGRVSLQALRNATGEALAEMAVGAAEELPFARYFGPLTVEEQATVREAQVRELLSDGRRGPARLIAEVTLHEQVSRARAGDPGAGEALASWMPTLLRAEPATLAHLTQLLADAIGVTEEHPQMAEPLMAVCDAFGYSAPDELARPLMDADDSARALACRLWLADPTDTDRAREYSRRCVGEEEQIATGEALLEVLPCDGVLQHRLARAYAEAGRHEECDALAAAAGVDGAVAWAWLMRIPSPEGVAPREVPAPSTAVGLTLDVDVDVPAADRRSRLAFDGVDELRVEHGGSRFDSLAGEPEPELGVDPEVGSIRPDGLGLD